ncbi:hypothetical protein CF394_04575 [Tetzosporium hominis]|uniref:Competence protein ComGF n=1 Tax=Tetzosporium hominis TaxID=2020506 RepID=A0A264W712_9BACL|nr:hypothetical protein CF394_04575 [Tetzosporium hominis]
MVCGKRSGRNFVYLQVNSQQGFSLLDQLLQLVISLSSLSLLVTVIASTAATTSKFADPYVQQVDSFWLEFQEVLHSSSNVRNYLGSCSVVMDSAGASIRYEKVGDRFRKTVNGAGNEPVLLEVQSCRILIGDNKLQMEITALSGVTYKKETLLYVP